MASRIFPVSKLLSNHWKILNRSNRLMDQYLDMITSSDHIFKNIDRQFPSIYYRPWADLMRECNNKGCSVVNADKDKFQVTLDVRQFKPDEVNVKIVDNCVVIEGKHEEKQDDHGTISRQFIRKYMIPEQCDIDKTTSTLSSDGVLTITTPRKPENLEVKKEKSIKIECTGKPAVEESEKIAQAQ